VLGIACRTVPSPPPVWVQMSTAHIYGDPPSVRCDEESPTGYGLAPTVGIAWEMEFARAVLPRQRGVVLRTSFVVGQNRGAGGGCAFETRATRTARPWRFRRQRPAGDELDSRSGYESAV
jgi:hypothetical protein